MTACSIMATYRYYFPFFNEVYELDPEFVNMHRVSAKIIAHSLIIIFVLYYLGSIVRLDENEVLLDIPVSLGIGVLFGIGLAFSGMCRRSKVYGFFTMNDSWDPSLAFVMGGAIFVNVITFSYARTKMKQPLLVKKSFPNPPSKITWRVIVGPTIFGLGWGI